VRELGQEAVEVAPREGSLGWGGGVLVVGLEVEPTILDRRPAPEVVGREDFALHDREVVPLPAPITTQVVVTTLRIPGLEVRLPAGSVGRDHAWQPASTISITPIPLDRPPFPLPPDVHPPAYFTIQPGGGYVSAPNGGARIVYPNRFAAHPGAGHSFWHYKPGDQDWYVYGLGHVTPDGTQIAPDPRSGVDSETRLAARRTPSNA
jgi:hypothetical protein